MVCAEIVVARKRLEINILTRLKLPDPPPSPAESNGRPLNFVVNVCYVCRICVAYWVNIMPSFNLAN